MKIYKYDNVTMIAVDKQTKQKLIQIKRKYQCKNMDKVINKLIDGFYSNEYYESEPYEKYHS